jgi:hypothetical protein
MGRPGTSISVRGSAFATTTGLTHTIRVNASEGKPIGN